MIAPQSCKPASLSSDACSATIFGLFLILNRPILIRCSCGCVTVDINKAAEDIAGQFNKIKEAVKSEDTSGKVSLTA